MSAGGDAVAASTPTVVDVWAQPHPTGPLNHRLFQGRAPLDDHFARAVVDIVVRGLGEVH